MGTLKAKPIPQGFVSFTELKHLSHAIDAVSDPDPERRIRKELVAELSAEHKALENPELDCWACYNNVNILQVKQQNVR